MNQLHILFYKSFKSGWRRIGVDNSGSSLQLWLYSSSQVSPQSQSLSQSHVGRIHSPLSSHWYSSISHVGVSDFNENQIIKKSINGLNKKWELTSIKIFIRVVEAVVICVTNIIFSYTPPVVTSELIRFTCRSS